jgi:hypothetical protein
MPWVFACLGCIVTIVSHGPQIPCRQASAQPDVSALFCLSFEVTTLVKWFKQTEESVAK